MTPPVFKTGGRYLRYRRCVRLAHASANLKDLAGLARCVRFVKTQACRFRVSIVQFGLESIPVRVHPKSSDVRMAHDQSPRLHGLLEACAAVGTADAAKIWMSLCRRVLSSRAIFVIDAKDAAAR